MLWMTWLACTTEPVQKDPPDTTPTTEPVTTPDPQTTDSGTPPVTDGCTHEVVGALGGAISRDGVTVTIPAAALAGDVELTLCPVDPPTDAVPVSAALLLGPSDLALAVAAEVQATHTGDPATTALFTPDASGAPVRQLAAQIGETQALGPLYHPGVLFAGQDLRTVRSYAAGGAGDLLVVMDNSCSMADEQARMAANMATVIDEMLASGVDFHLGVVSTDMDDPNQSGRLRDVAGTKWVDPLTPAPADTFSDLVNTGTFGSGNEQGLLAAYTALELLGATDNAGFARDGVPLAVLTVSDEADGTPAGALTVAEYIAWLDGLQGLHGSTWNHSLSDPTLGVDYQAASAGTGGIDLDIGTADWTSFLHDVVGMFGDSDTGMMLAPLPVDGTLEAWAVPSDGAEPFALDPAVVGWDPVEGRVTIAAEDLPVGAAVYLLYLAA